MGGSTVLLVNNNHSLLFTLLCTLGGCVSRFRGRARFGWSGRGIHKSTFQVTLGWKGGWRWAESAGVISMFGYTQILA